MGGTLYLTDLDGTLLDSSGHLAEESAQILTGLLERGMQFSFATARSFHSAGPLVQALPLRLPVAVYNGAFLVQPPQGTPLHMHLPDKTDLAQLLHGFWQLGLSPFVYTLLDGRERVGWVPGTENEGMRRYLDSRQGDKRQRPVTNPIDLLVGQPYYITLIGTQNEAEGAEHLLHQHPNLTYHLQEDTYCPGEYWLEVFHAEANKASALRWLKQHTGADEVVCFGDNLNDLPMFHAADRAYAVANAHPDLRAAATGVIESNDACGVARWLEEAYG